MPLIFQPNDLIVPIHNSINNFIYKIHDIIIEEGNDWHDRVDYYYYAYIENLMMKIIYKDLIGFQSSDGNVVLYYEDYNP